MNKVDLKSFGLTEEHSKEASCYNGLFLARVTAQYPNLYTIITEAGECRAVVSGKLKYTVQDAGDYPAVGDWVVVDRMDDANGEAVISKILHRKSCLIRKAAGTGNEIQVIAANIDIVFICMSLNADFNLRRMERYLSLIWESMAMPVIVLTKSDCCQDLDTKLLELQMVAAGVDTVAVSSFTEGGLNVIKKYLQTGKTVAFTGSSGVGKSTIINKLLGEDRQATKQICEGDEKGRHATTNRQLFLLPEGGVVIDTPGMRELQLSKADVGKAFADIEELSKQCFFSNCAHQNEPKCAVKQAVADGRLEAKRLENYKKLQKELLFEERKQSMSAARAEKQKFIGMMGSLNSYKRILRENPKNR